MPSNALSGGAGAALEPKQCLFIETLATPPYPSIKDAADVCKVNYRTGRRWYQMPHVQAALVVAYADSERLMKDRARRRAIALTEKAVDAVAEGLQADDLAMRVDSGFKLLKMMLPEEKSEGATAANVHVRISLNDREIVRADAE